MSIEKRLTDHMNEFAEMVDIPAGNAEQVTQRASNGGQRAITTVTAALVLLLAGAGFLFLANGNPDTTSLAAGEENESGETATDGDEAADAAPLELDIIDVSSSDAPSFGRTTESDGVYYVLSTAPGPMDPNVAFSEAEANHLYRPNTFYVLNEDREWQVSTVDDRFVSDFAVDNGVLYALSTGSITSDSATFGTSSDRGASWNWEPLDGLPTADEVALFVTDDETLIYGSRGDRTDYEWAINVARENGVNVSDRTVQQLDERGIVYFPVDPTDECLVYASQFVQELTSMQRYYEQAEADGSLPEGEIDNMLMYFRDETTYLGCGWDLQTVDDVMALDVPAPVSVSWDELGITVPEDWKSWRGLFAMSDGTLVEKELPFGSDGPGWATVRDGSLDVSVYTPGDLAEVGYDLGTEVIWSTSDGDNWTSVEADYNDERYYLYDNSYGPPTAGGHQYRMWYDEEKQAAQDELIRAADAAVAAGELTEEEAYGDLAFDTPSILQRSTGDGEWETVDPATYSSGLDLDNPMLQDVRASSLGLVLVFSDTDWEAEFPDSGSAIAFSNDGENWETLNVVGNDNSIISAEGSVLILSHDWVIRPDETMGRSEAFLVQAAG